MGSAQEQQQLGWTRGAVVSVSRLPDRGQPMARPMGLGILLDPLEVGRSVRIRLDEGRALAPSTVVRIDTIAPHILRIETRHHRYELRRVEGATAAVGVLPVHDHLSREQERMPFSEPGGETRIVEIDEWPEPAPGRFESGARVRVVRMRDGSPCDLGEGLLLVDLVPGEITSFSFESGVIGTSPILSMAELEGGRLEIVTRNSRYEVELAGQAEKDDETEVDDVEAP